MFEDNNTVQSSLAAQRDRITQLLSNQSQPSKLGQGLDLAGAFLSSLSKNTGAAGVHEYMQNVEQARQQNQAADLQKQMGLYNLMQDQAKQGNEDAVAVDKAIKDIAGNDISAYSKIASALQEHPEPVNKTNATLLASRAAAKMGYKPMSQTADELELQYKRSQIAKNMRPEAGADGGATGVIISNVMKDNPGMSYTEALQLVQTGLRSGTRYNKETGGYENIPGYLGTREQTKKAEASGKIAGEQQTEAAINLPTAQANADYMINLLDDLKKDPGLKDVVGLKGKGAIPMYLGINKAIPGTNAANFMARLEQIKGKQFLEAYQSLRGSGQISNVEGDKATKAISRMDSAQSEKEFLSAANELQDIVKKGAARARQRAGFTNAAVEGKKRYKYNPTTGQVE